VARNQFRANIVAFGFRSNSSVKLNRVEFRVLTIAFKYFFRTGNIGNVGHKDMSQIFLRPKLCNGSLCNCDILECRIKFGYRTLRLRHFSVSGDPAAPLSTMSRFSMEGTQTPSCGSEKTIRAAPREGPQKIFWLAA
jgi:hypothetical protein